MDAFRLDELHEFDAGAKLLDDLLEDGYKVIGSGVASNREGTPPLEYTFMLFVLYKAREGLES